MNRFDPKRPLVGIRNYIPGSNYLVRTDGKGNVTEIRRQNGTVAASYGYSPFGQLLYQTNTLAQSFRFSTRLTHGRSGYVYFLGRWYAPDLGTFLSRDPIKEEGGIHLYQYCANNPVNYIDPYGLVQWRAAGGAILGVIGNTFGLALGFGLALVPEPTMATKVAAVAVVGKSSYGFGANVNNLVAAFRDQAPPSHGALANDIAELVAPGNANAQRVATIADLTTDLAAGRIAGAAVQNALGRLYPYDMERVFYLNPDDLGPLATGLLVFDLLRINYVTYSDLYRGSDDCK